ncbi:MAG TPA: TraB/GumN family protein [Caulobacteraceae bacterium]
MRAPRFALGLAALALAAIGPARAAPPPGLEDPEGKVVSELVVRGVLPGPAWWTVQRGGSVVYILGLPDEPLPKGQRWDQAALQRRVAGASALIVPVEPKAGLGDIPALLRMRSRLKSPLPMDQGLPEPLRARFTAARAGLGKPLSRYDGWDPIAAGQILVIDFYDRARVTTKEPLAGIRRLASRQDVRVRPAASFRVVGLLDPAIRNLTPEMSRACLAEALDEVEAGAGALNSTGAAWAQGDVAGVLAGPRGFSICLLLLQGGAAFWRQTIAQEVDAVAGALNKPGHTVAVLPIRSLLASDGVLSRLTARGYQVSAEARKG